MDCRTLQDIAVFERKRRTFLIYQKNEEMGVEAARLVDFMVENKGVSI